MSTDAPSDATSGSETDETAESRAFAKTCEALVDQILAGEIDRDDLDHVLTCFRRGVVEDIRVLRNA